jgi:hypothetical protein
MGMNNHKVRWTSNHVRFGCDTILEIQSECCD